jgi:hypothetical protein
MLAQLVALGILSSAAGGDPGVGDVIASPDRTVTAVILQTTANVGSLIPLGAQQWRQPFDPADHAPFAFDFGPLLDEGEKIADIEQISLNATAALLGLTVDASADYAPIIDVDGEVLQVWFIVDQAYWAAASFNASGVQLPVTFRIVTDATPPKRYERTAVLSVRQQ